MQIKKRLFSIKYENFSLTINVLQIVVVANGKLVILTEINRCRGDKGFQEIDCNPLVALDRRWAAKIVLSVTDIIIPFAFGDSVAEPYTIIEFTFVCFVADGKFNRLRIFFCARIFFVF